MHTVTTTRLNHSQLPWDTSPNYPGTRHEQLLGLRGVTFEYTDPEGIHELPGREMGVKYKQLNWISDDLECLLGNPEAIETPRWRVGP